MGSRLVLSTVGIKSPLDVGADDDAPTTRQAPPKATASRSERRRAPTARARAATPAFERPAQQEPFYGSGRPVQTSIALDADFATLLDELARAGHTSANALAVAALHAGLPVTVDAARTAIVDERVRRAGERAARVERNFRLPEHLRTRVDELTAAAREHLPRGNRADLINAALRRGLPTNAQLAASLVAKHTQRVERLAAA